MLRETREASCLNEIQMAQQKKIRVLRMVMRATMMTMMKRIPSTGQKYIKEII